MVQMEWTQVLVLVFGNIAWMLPLWLWNRSESRTDQRQMLSIVQSIQKDSKDFQQAMMLEMKDFHGRLERHDAEFKAHLMHHHKD
jgi:hypothetical protein